MEYLCRPNGFQISNNFQVTSKSKDWTDTVQVEDCDGSGTGGHGGTNKYDVSSLLEDAPFDSIKQKINVEREEQTVEGPLSANDEAILNSDVVSEKVDLDLVDGQIQVTVCVRCERTVPLYSVQCTYKKSSVIVTRRVQIDMECTDQRRQLYAMLQRRHDIGCDGERLRLGAKETFQLYKGFMGLVEANETARTNSLKPQPGSILADDIFKRPISSSSCYSSRHQVNGGTPSNPYEDRPSHDCRTPSDLSAYSTGGPKESTDSLHEIKLGCNSDAMTSYSSRLASKPGTTPFSYLSRDLDSRINSSDVDTPSSRYSRYDSVPRAENGISSYASRFSSLTSQRDNGGKTSGDTSNDFTTPTSRMSAYDRYRSKSPYRPADDRLASSRLASADSDVGVTPIVSSSRYERVMSSRSRSPFRTDTGVGASPFLTHALLVDHDDPPINHDPVDFTSRPMSSRYRSPFTVDDRSTTSRYSTRAATIGNDLCSTTTNVDHDPDDYATRLTSKYAGGTLFGGRENDSTSAISPYLHSDRIALQDQGTGVDNYARSTLLSRYNRSSSLSDQGDGGSNSSSFASRFAASRFGASGERDGDCSGHIYSSSSNNNYSDNKVDRVAADANYLASRYSYLNSISSQKNSGNMTSSDTAVTEAPCVPSSSIRQSGANNDVRTDMTTAVSRTSTMTPSPRDSLSANADAVAQSPTNGATEQVDEHDRSLPPTVGSPESSTESTTVTKYNIQTRRSRPEVNSDDAVVTANGGIDNVIDEVENVPPVMPSSVKLLAVGLEEDNSMQEVAEAINAAMTSLSHVTSSNGHDTTVTSSSPRNATPTADRFADSEPEIDRNTSLAVTQQTTTQERAAATPASSNQTTKPTSSLRARRLSGGSGPGSVTSLTQQTAASSARRNSASSASGVAAPHGTVPSYARSTSTSVAKKTATDQPPSDTQHQSMMSRTRSSPTLRDANFIARLPNTSEKAASRSTTAATTGTRPATASSGRGAAATPSDQARRGSATSSSTTASRAAASGTAGTTPRSGNPSGSSVTPAKAANGALRRPPSGGSRTTTTTALASTPSSGQTSSGHKMPTAATQAVTTARSAARPTGATAANKPATANKPPIMSSKPTAAKPAVTPAVRPYRSRTGSTSTS